MPGDPKRRLAVLGGLLAAAAVIVVVAIVISQSGSDDDGGSSGAGSASTAPAEARDIFESIPQEGIRLGAPDAPATVVEFADLQCPFCAQFSTGALAEVVDTYVRPGRIAMELDVLAFLGPDSEPAAQWAAAASLQNRIWQFAETFFANQGEENSGYVTDAFLEDVASKTPGLDLEQLRADLDDPRVDRIVRAASRRAERFEIQGTPSFVLVRDGRPPQQLELQALDAGSFGSALEQALGE